MFNFRLWLAIGLAAWGAPALGQCFESFGSSGCFAPSTKRVVRQQFVATNFAVPIGVTVAEVAPFFYSYAPQTYQPQAQQQPLGDDAMRALIREEIERVMGVRPQVQDQPPPEPQAYGDGPVPSALATACAKCHTPGGAGSTPAAIGHLDLSNLSALTDDQRFAAIRSVLHAPGAKPMPKGGKLESEQVAQIIDELTR